MVKNDIHLKLIHVNAEYLALEYDNKSISGDLIFNKKTIHYSTNKGKGVFNKNIIKNIIISFRDNKYYIILEKKSTINIKPSIFSKLNPFKKAYNPYLEFGYIDTKDEVNEIIKFITQSKFSVIDKT